MRLHRPTLLALTVAIGLGGCNGALLLDPDFVGCEGAECDLCDGVPCIVNTEPCSIAAPDGKCPDDLICNGGVCSSSSTSWCDCDPDEGWNNGVCIAVTQVLECSAARPTGLCRQCATCLDGICIQCEAARACSQDQPQGCCPSGASCSDGACVAISDDSCSQSNPDGLCPEGKACIDGSCTEVQCSASEPLGMCPGADEICRNGTCEVICATGEFLSVVGTCIADGTCSANADCSASEICNKAQTCIVAGTCGVDADCLPFHECDASGACVRDYDCNGPTDCPVGEFCSVAGTCLLNGQCGAVGDCGTNEYCAVAGQCAANGTCVDDRDCGTNEFCSGTSACTQQGSCNTSADCATDRSCDANSDCVVPPVSECTGDLTDQGCTPAELTCCPSGLFCCPQGSRCASDGGCLAVGECVDDTDCITGFVCTDFECAAQIACSSPADCAPDECSILGGCIPANSCATAFDCRLGVEICSPDNTCEPDTTCGADRYYSTTLVEPNMLIVLDRSGSMDWGLTCGNTGCAPPSRWEVAVEAIDQVVAANQDKIRFGLVTFRGNNAAMTPAVYVGYIDAGATPPTAHQTIMNALNSVSPTGSTPTGEQLRAIADDPSVFGLPDPADPITRNNYIMLVTDGDPTRSGGTYGVCDGLSGSGSSRGYAEINCALDYMRTTLDPSITTFSVGVVGGSPDNNNCHAVHGGTSNCGSPAQCLAIGTDQTTCAALEGCNWNGTDCDAGVDDTNCRVEPTDPNGFTCFYPASDAATLTAAFNDIAGRIASCSYTINGSPPDLNRIFVYHDMADGSGLVWISRDYSRQDGWDLDTAVSPPKVNFFGPACDTLMNMLANPIVVYGCCIGEGC